MDTSEETEEKKSSKSKIETIRPFTLVFIAFLSVSQIQITVR